eukprot:TRINITY_DN28656_c0_g1_i1.p1 TRINITY_DN28656_c0_g1~~TRINITY_DN28656_c0_g1_i1.p1  ORF type:complete len:216 (-),score=56.84 TRINITY_DN28656_c0_g1_i1:74-721(-)
MDLSPSELRAKYSSEGLTEANILPDPIDQFKLWFSQALESNIYEPNAMSLATCSADGRPSNRMVLLKQVDQRGFVFYTNSDSRKGSQLADNPHAALCFWWGVLERQVRIEGTVERIELSETEKYFRSRPRGSQIGAWASRQSSVLAGRDELEQQVADCESRFGDEEIPVPGHWGGHRVVPTLIEFWKGRTSRLHDRLQFTRSSPDDSWTLVRLSP